MELLALSRSVCTQKYFIHGIAAQCLVTNNANGPPEFPGRHGDRGLEITRQ